MSPRVCVTRTRSSYRPLRQTSSDDLLPAESVTVLASSFSPVNAYLMFIIFVATLGPFQFGYHLGELNAPESVITCRAKDALIATASNAHPSSLPQCIPMNSAQWGMVQSAFTVGGLIGSLATGTVSSKYGRLPAMTVLTCALAAGSATEATASSAVFLAFGRFISGLGAGSATVVCPIYIAEVSPSNKRGFFGAFNQVMINAGILMAQSLGYFLSRRSLWRIILAFPGFISIATLLALVFAPETPTWLAEKGKTRSARTVLRKVRGEKADIVQEMQRWKAAEDDEGQFLLGCPRLLEAETCSNMTFIGVIRVPIYRKAVLAVTATFVAQQLCGINAVMMYSVAILGNTIPSAAASITVIVSAINLTVSVLCTPLPDSIGRKACLVTSIAGMGTSSAMLAIGLSQEILVLTVIGLFTFVTSFGVGLGPVPFILASEVVGSEAAGALSSWALAGNWVSMFAVAQFFPIINQVLPVGQVFWIFVGMALVLGSFIVWQVPETNGKADTEEI